jgi:hypothetical protein
LDVKPSLTRGLLHAGFAVGAEIFIKAMAKKPGLKDFDKSRKRAVVNAAEKL